MAALFRDGQGPPQRVLEIIVRLFHGSHRPLYLGIVSLEVGWSLARTQEMFDLLEEQGTIRPARPEEKQLHGMASVANVYVLVSQAHPSKAHW